MTVLGIDTSHHNALPDFAALKRGGIGFVLAKATEGTGFADPQYTASRAGAHTAGQVFGSYHFARPGDPVAQADYYLSVAKPAPGEIPALDMEDTTIADPPGFSVAWCERVHARTGCWPLVYLNSWFLLNFDWSPVVRDGDGLWLAKYDHVPTGGPDGVWPVIAVKQFTDRAVVPGQPGQVDEDAFAGDLAALAAYAIPSTVQEDDMTPAESATLTKVYQVIMRQVPGGVQDNLDVGKAVLAQVKATQVSITALQAAVTALASSKGADPAAVLTAVHDEVAKALAGATVTVTAGGATLAGS